MVEEDSMPIGAIFVLYALTCFSITGIIGCNIRDYRKKKIKALNPVPAKKYNTFKRGPIVRG